MLRLQHFPSSPPAAAYPSVHLQGSAAVNLLTDRDKLLTAVGGLTLLAVGVYSGRCFVIGNTRAPLRSASSLPLDWQWWVPPAARGSAESPAQRPWLNAP